MKYALLVLGVGAVVITSPTQAATTVANGNFASGDLTSWNCPVDTSGNCNTASDKTSLNADPYWMHVDTGFTFGTDTYALHIGAWDVTNPGFIWQSVGGFKSNSYYFLNFSYGQYNPYSLYTSPDFTETDKILASVGTSTSSLSGTFSATNFYTTAGSNYGVAGTGYKTTAQACFQTPNFGNQGSQNNYVIQFSAYDTLQDVILSDITVTTPGGGTCTPTTGTLTTQFFVGGAWIDGGTTTFGDAIDSAPEPKTFALLAVALAALLFASKKFRFSHN